MSADKLAAVVPVDDLAAAVAWWEDLLGVEPTFVDGDRWAQFDLGGTRLALAGADRTDDRPGVLVKVPDVDARRGELLAAGVTVGELEVGPHETRCTVDGAGPVSVTLYSSS
ncbi:MAG: VOC family protein [Actinomycetota bacterium]